MFIRDKIRPLFHLTIVLLVVSLTGCVHNFKLASSPSVLNQLSIGMEKQQAIDLMGKNGKAVGAFMDDSGEVIDILEYNASGQYLQALIDGKLYWLYFKNDKLIRWGRADKYIPTNLTR